MFRTILSYIALLVKLGVQHLFTTHGTHTFTVCTRMTIFGILMYLLLADYAFIISIRSPSLFLGEELVLIDLAAAALAGVAGPFFPLIRHYHLPQFLLTLLADH